MFTIVPHRYDLGEQSDKKATSLVKNIRFNMKADETPNNKYSCWMLIELRSDLKAKYLG